MFSGFTGTSAQSDSSRACVSGLWLFAFPNRPDRSGTREVSRFSCMLFLGVPGVFDYAGPSLGSRLTPWAGVAFPLTVKGRHPVLCFRSSIAQPTTASVYASPATSQRPAQDSRSGWSRSLLSCRALASPTTCRFIPAHPVPEAPVPAVPQCRLLHGTPRPYSGASASPGPVRRAEVPTMLSGDEPPTDGPYEPAWTLPSRYANAEPCFMAGRHARRLKRRSPRRR